MDARRFGPPWPCYVVAGDYPDDPAAAVVHERWDRSDDGELYFYCGTDDKAWWPDGGAEPRCEHLKAVKEARRAARLDGPDVGDDWRDKD